VHFAAESHVTNSIYDDNVFFETDINGTRVLIRALVRHKDTVERFVHISTSEVYGTAIQRPMTEDHPLAPFSPYAAAKAGADRLVYAYWRTYDIPVVVLRPFNNYGPNQHIEKVIPRFIIQALQGQSMTVHGSGNQLRDWVHTTDTCRAIDKALHVADFNKIKGQCINIGSGRAISILDIAHKILNCLNLPEARINFIEDRPGQVDCHIAANDKAKELLDWQPTVSFEDGIVSVVDWYKDHREWWKHGFIISDFMVKAACLS
jgi:dTDP-glucose 4,6-dehydratase